MKKVIPLIGLCSILYFAGINSSLVLAKNDYIKVKNGKGYVYTISENEGNKQVNEVAKTAKKEDAWIYAAGKWYDIGKSEKEDNVLIPLKDVVKLLKKNHKDEKEAKFVHIHPKKYVQEGVAPPSTYDISTHGKLKRMLRDNLQMKLSPSEIYTGDGVWTYEITDSLEEDINNAKPGHFSKWMILESMILRETLLILGNKSSSKEKKIEDYISAVKRLGIIASYKALEK